MARRKTTKKPVRRRPAAKSGNSFGKMGWLAAAAVAVGWIASDGRAVAYVGRYLPQTEAQATARPSPVRQASLRPSASADTDGDTRPFAAERTRVPLALKPPRPAAAVPTHVAAVAPSPAPRLAPLRMPPKEEPAAAPVRATPLPPMRPQAMIADRAPAPAITAAAAPAGEMRHATRLLVMRDSPDDSGKHVGSVVSGMQVEVLRANGHWRLVRSGDGTGWVDGTYLAGEASALLAPAPRAVMVAIPMPPAARIAAPLPPMAISAR